MALGQLHAVAALFLVGFGLPAEAAEVGRTYDSAEFTYDASTDMAMGTSMEAAHVVGPIDHLNSTVPRAARIAGQVYDPTANFVAPQSVLDDVGLSNRGLTPAPGTRGRPAGVPDEWRVAPARGEGGTWYYDPSNKGYYVRVMQGSPNSPYPNSQTPYVRWQRNGHPLHASGNVLPTANTPDAHIPLQDFEFLPGVFGP